MECAAIATFDKLGHSNEFIEDYSKLIEGSEIGRKFSGWRWRYRWRGNLLQFVEREEHSLGKVKCRIRWIDW